MADPRDIPNHILSQAASWWNRRERGERGIDEKLDAWLLADPLHRRAFEAVRDIWEASSGLGDLPIGQHRQLRRAPFYMRRNTHVALATLGAFACMFLVATLLVQSRSPFAPVTAAYAADLATRRGEIRAFEIQGGASLVLDSLSRAKVTRDADTYRLTLEAGRVRVHPGSGNQQWLIVAGGTQARVAGAAYDVSVIARQPRLVAIDGPIEMIGKTGAMSLVSGEAAPLGCDTCPPKRIARGEVQWISGMLVFEATPLDEAVRAINRYNTVQIRMLDKAIARQRITGAFRASDPQAFAKAVAAMFDQKVSASNPGEIVLVPS
ncbi:FecR domain-containing protein [Novosphingobium sp. M1R2S20]|uniref:FecR domain-containing protein n=1 Tax=Novosphingobium rhizovicinum TaxID=3228928 RepID=A0ABV3RF23_9SPHN